MAQPISPNFVRTTIELYGDNGRSWLQNLPHLIADCEKRWSLTVRPPFLDLSYNYVAPAIRSDGTAVVLKLGIVNPELLTEIEALRLYDGRGSVRLLEADPEQGILLLERLRPGIPLISLDDEEATIIAARVMRQLWRPLPPAHPFPTVARWAAGLTRLRQQFDGGTGPFPAKWVDKAESLFNELLPSQAEPVLLHGDLHHWNILQAQRAPWLALDPKGIAGEPVYEVGALLRNPFPWLAEQPSPTRILARRVDILAELLGFDRGRIIGWGAAQAVLSGWWLFEDHGHGWEGMFAFVEWLTAVSK